jgi:glycosyltransferase involved in cell wall biosynthesis
VLGTDHSNDVTDRRKGCPRIKVLTLARNVGTCYGGAERVAFEYVKRMNPERFERYLCVTHAPPDGRQEADEADMDALRRTGVQILKLECRSLPSNIAWASVYRRLTRESIDVLHAHMPRASVPGTIIGRLARVPVIVNQEHGWAFQGKPVRRFLDRNVVARGSDVLLAVSEWDRRHMVEIERIPYESIRILPNGTPPAPESGRDVRDVRAELGVSPGTALIGAVGRLYPEKGYDDLIRAIAVLERDSPCPFLCVILGHGPERQRLQALIDELHVAHVVKLVGRRKDVPDVIRALDVAVLCSKNEGSPLAVMEYMAGAAPIVATAVGGVPELVKDGVHGVLVEPRDPEALAAAIRRLLVDRPLASRLGTAARERQRNNYDLDLMVRRLEDLYIELTNARARRKGDSSQTLRRS